MEEITPTTKAQVIFIKQFVNISIGLKCDASSSSLSVDIVSSHMRFVFQVTNYVVICGCVSLCGIGGNILNLIVFVRQGFKDRINISLFGLAVADLMCLITIFWSSICYNPMFARSGLPFDSIDVMYLTGGWPHACFNRVTSFITAFITLERCLCITLPLKVKNIITPLRTKLIIASIFVTMFIVFSPFYFVNTLKWGFNSSLNRTILSLSYTRDREIVETITFPIHSVALSVISLFSVIICTVVLVVKLNKKTKWRQTSVAQIASKPEVTSTKDKKIIKMIILISTVFIVCFVPASAIFFMMAYEPEFSFTGGYKNIFFVVWSVSFVLETINSSVNIFIYFKMSSKFRATLITILCTCTEE